MSFESVSSVKNISQKADETNVWMFEAAQGPPLTLIAKLE
jgi:hypothetical protein